MDRSKTDTVSNENPNPSLGLSKIVYAFGESVKTGLLGFFAAWVASTLLVHFGKGSVPGIKKVAELPEDLKRYILRKWGQGAGEWGREIILGFGFASVVGYITHIPGLIAGPRKVARAEQLYDDQVHANSQLVHANKLLVEDNERLKSALSKTSQGRMSHTDRINSAPSAETGVNVV
jgi:hypothetical protein